MRRIVFILLWIIAGAHGSWADTTWVEQGDLRGQWTSEGSPYMIMGHLQVVGRDTFSIERGTKVVFTGPYRIFIYGDLEVEGTADAPVLFTVDTTQSPNGWGGLRFISAESKSHLNHCIIERGRADGVSEYGLGGAIYCDNSQVELNDSEIRLCVAGSGHAIYAREQSRITLNRTLIFGNGTLYGSGGGVCLRIHSELIASESIIENNTALYGGGITVDESSIKLDHCAVLKNTAGVSGGGIYATNSTLDLQGTMLNGNTSLAGGAIDGRSVVQMTMNRCVFANNSANQSGGQGHGGAILLQSGAQEITQCTFVGNSAALGGAIYGGSSLRIRNSIFARQIEGGAVYFSMPGVTVQHNCFAVNEEGDFVGPQQPRNIGVLSTVNVNGDSCDTYHNLLMNPLLNDSSANMYELTEHSPCINAGDPGLPHDPDGSLADLGAFWFIPLSRNDAVPALPKTIALHPAYPNPFNPSTNLTFDVAREGLVVLQVYDLLGRRMATLIDSKLQPGQYTAAWNAADVPSGTYFAVLEEGGVRFTQKLLLLK